MYKEFFTYNLSKTLTGASYTQFLFTDTELKIATDYDFEINKISYVATSSSINVIMANRGIADNMVTLNPMGLNITSIAGYISRGVKSYILSKPYLIKKGSKIAFEFQNYSLLSNTVRLSFHGTKIINNKDSELLSILSKEKEIGIYSNSKTVSASSKNTLIIQTDNDSYFSLKQMNGYSLGACLINFTSSGIQKDWMNEPTHVSNILGTGSFSNNIVGEKILAPNTVISVSLEDLSASSNTVYISLIGEKLYV